jgi:hypothetical protein
MLPFFIHWTWNPRKWAGFHFERLPDSTIWHLRIRWYLVCGPLHLERLESKYLRNLASIGFSSILRDF